MLSFATTAASIVRAIPTMMKPKIDRLKRQRGAFRVGYGAFIDTVRPEHTELLVIDVQNDFCAAGGARMKGDLTTIEEMKAPTRRIVEAARSIGVPVVDTQTQNDGVRA